MRGMVNSQAILCDERKQFQGQRSLLVQYIQDERIFVQREQQRPIRNNDGDFYCFKNKIT